MTTTDHDTCRALAAWLGRTPEEAGMGTDCPCGHPRDDHERYVGCLAPSNWLAVDVPFCPCDLEYDHDTQQ